MPNQCLDFCFIFSSFLKQVLLFWSLGKFGNCSPGIPITQHTTLTDTLWQHQHFDHQSRREEKMMSTCSVTFCSWKSKRKKIEAMHCSSTRHDMSQAKNAKDTDQVSPVHIWRGKLTIKYVNLKIQRWTSLTVRIVCRGWEGVEMD